MAGSRTLKLSILADIDNLKKNLGQADNEIQGFGGKLEKFGKVAAAAFAAAAAAAAAYAGKLAIDGVKAAIADEAAQNRLANALKNVTGATNEQIAAVEKQIEKMSVSFGIADEQLRPSFQRLATIPPAFVIVKRRNHGIEKSWVIQDLEQWMRERYE